MNGQKTTIVVRLILEEEGKILFLKKTPQNGGGFSLVGGKVDNGESANLAIIRESMEEANIQIKRRHLRLVHIFKRESVRELILVYSSKKWEGELESKEPEKFKKLVWIPKNEFPKNISETTRSILEAYAKNKFFKEDNGVSVKES